MFRWKKIGKVFDPTEVCTRPWMKEFAQAPCVLKFDHFVRVYFSCRPKMGQNGQYVSYTGFVDLERKDLFKIINISQDPILPLGNSGTFDEFGIYPTTVIRKENAVIAYYGGWTRCESVPFNVAIGYAVSYNDGISFQRIHSGPVLSYSIDEPFVISGPKIRSFNGILYLWYIAGRKWVLDHGKPEPIYKIRLATSTDGLNWEKKGADLIPDKLGPDEAQASPDVFFSNNKYHMFFCYRYGTDYRNKERGYRIGYAYSTDLRFWTRDDDKAGIDISSEGWDSEMISYPHVFELDGEIYMLYLGNQVGRFGFGLATLEGSLK